MGSAPKLTTTPVHVVFMHSEHTLLPIGPKLCVYKGLRDEQVLNQILPLKVPAKQEIEMIGRN